jgi:hypothetical protein
MDSKNKEIQTTQDPAVLSMPQVIQFALQNNAGVEQLEKMMQLQERYEANEAKKAYHVAMAAFKANPPKIDKDSNVKYGQTEYNHATLGNVTEKINKALSEHGLSAAWQTSQKDKMIAVTCKITHILGHSESTRLEAGADTSGAKNSIQAIGSTVTYLQRYTILSLTGLATEEMDDDGNGSEAEYVNEEQVKKWKVAIENKKIDMSMFLDYMGSKSIDKILVRDIKKADIAIKNAKGTR